MMKRFTEFKPYRKGESDGRYVQYAVTGCGNDSDRKGDYTTGASVDRLAELEDKIEQGTLIELKELKKAFWQYIGRHGTVVTNGNIDFIIEDCLKEMRNEN